MSTSAIRLERDLDAVLRRALAHHHDAALERLRQRERRDLELDLPGLDLGQVEDVVDEREQVVPGREDVLDVLVLLLVELAEELLAQHLREADDRVQRRPQLVRHVREELRLVPARGLELAALLVELAQRRLELAGPLLDLLLEARIGLLELRRHAVELLGERARARRCSMTSIRWSSEPSPIFAAAAWIDSIGRAIRRASRTLVAVARSRNATSRNAVRQIADLSGANASLSGSSTKTRQPSRVDGLEGAEHFRTVVVAPDRRRVVGAIRRAARARLAPAAARRSSFA